MARGILPVMAAVSMLPAWACGPYRVALYDFGRLYYRNAEGQITGIDKEVIDTLARRSGCTFEVKVDSRVRIWTALKAGSVDVVTSALATPDRLALGEFAPYLQARNQLLVRQGLAPGANTLAGLLAEPGLRVVVVKSFVHGAPFDDWLTEMRRQGRLSEVGDFEAVLRVFAAGHADAIVASCMTLPLVKRAFGEVEGFRVIESAIGEPREAGLLFSRRTVSEADRQRLRAALAAMVRDGTVFDILKRHLDERAAAATRLGP